MYVTCHRATGTYENRTGPHNILADYLLNPTYSNQRGVGGRLCSPDKLVLIHNSFAFRCTYSIHYSICLKFNATFVHDL